MERLAHAIRKPALALLSVSLLFARCGAAGAAAESGFCPGETKTDCRPRGGPDARRLRRAIQQPLAWRFATTRGSGRVAAERGISVHGHRNMSGPRDRSPPAFSRLYTESIGNAWWDRQSSARVNCTEDRATRNVGAARTGPGDSAARLLAPSSGRTVARRHSRLAHRYDVGESPFCRDAGGAPCGCSRMARRSHGRFADFDGVRRNASAVCRRVYRRQSGIRATFRRYGNFPLRRRLTPVADLCWVKRRRPGGPRASRIRLLPRTKRRAPHLSRAGGPAHLSTPGLAASGRRRCRSNASRRRARRGFPGHRIFRHGLRRSCLRPR